uniref:Uncharacterized protein n=1 Tax=Romanomermis culicivorax TaxID=13658 RepID=A0A915I788_ROMCU
MYKEVTYTKHGCKSQKIIFAYFDINTCRALTVHRRNIIAIRNIIAEDLCQNFLAIVEHEIPICGISVARHVVISLKRNRIRNRLPASTTFVKLIQDCIDQNFMLITT